MPLREENLPEGVARMNLESTVTARSRISRRTLGPFAGLRERISLLAQLSQRRLNLDAYLFERAIRG